MDVIITGAGPAGVAAAITLRKNGLKCIIVTKKYKTENDAKIVETITGQVYFDMCNLGVGHAIKNASLGLYMQKWLAEEDQGEEIALTEKNEFGYHVCKNTLQLNLREEIRKLGIEILETDTSSLNQTLHNRFSVCVSTNNILTAKYIIDASGGAKIMGRHLKLKENLYSPPLTAWSGISLIKNPPPVDHKTGFQATETGWTWLAPLFDGNCAWTRLAPTSMCDMLPPLPLQHFPHATKIRCSNVSWRMFENVAGPGYLIAGDAAGVLDPATGHGISKALNSGILAAEAVSKILFYPEKELELLQQYNETFTVSYKRDARLLKFYYGNMGCHF